MAQTPGWGKWYIPSVARLRIETNALVRWVVRRWQRDQLKVHTKEAVNTHVEHLAATATMAANNAQDAARTAARAADRVEELLAEVRLSRRPPSLPSLSSVLWLFSIIAVLAAVALGCLLRGVEAFKEPALPPFNIIGADGAIKVAVELPKGAPTDSVSLHKLGSTAYKSGIALSYGPGNLVKLDLEFPQQFIGYEFLVSFEGPLVFDHLSAPGLSHIDRVSEKCRNVYSTDDLAGFSPQGERCELIRGRVPATPSKSSCRLPLGSTVSFVGLVGTLHYEHNVDWAHKIVDLMPPTPGAGSLVSSWNGDGLGTSAFYMAADFTPCLYYEFNTNWAVSDATPSLTQSTDNYILGWQPATSKFIGFQRGDCCRTCHWDDPRCIH
jgi:hypothetical protein